MTRHEGTGCTLQQTTALANMRYCGVCLDVSHDIRHRRVLTTWQFVVDDNSTNTEIGKQYAM